MKIRALAPTCLASLTAFGALALPASALGAFTALPSNGSQVNAGPAPFDATHDVLTSDLTSGSLGAGNPFVPWTAFEQVQANGSHQILVRVFKNGAWQTQGFPESLNIDQSQAASAPSIDFTGGARTVPWVGWAEPNTALGTSQIFASRFVTQPAPAQNGGIWQDEGQGRPTIASLNINTNRKADLPALIGGSTNPANPLAPWLTWQEFDGAPGPATPVSGAPQIFVSHAVPAATGCSKPVGGAVGGHNFCFQQVGIDRVIGPALGQMDPSLNIDPSRSGIESDIAFTGAGDTVPWVVWYENSDSNGGHPSTIGLQNQDMVFAARAVPDATPPANEDGKFHWQVVGLGTAGVSTPGSAGNVLDTTGPQGFGTCATSTNAENACSLNVGANLNLAAGSGGENPSVTAGTLVPGKPTTPWIVWDESATNGGNHSIFVARLDPAGDHFNLLNSGQPISHSGLDSTRSDISFVGNTPYVSWHETNGGQTVTVVGHFEGSAANPVFVIDTPPAGVPTTPAGAADPLRSPMGSTCPDNQFTSDGSACPGGSVGTPFFAYGNSAAGPQGLFAQGYTPGTVQTGGASGVSQNAATVAGSVRTDGASALVRVEFGTTTSYGSATPQQLLPPAAGTATAISAALGGLPARTLIHYRVDAQTDFGPVVTGADATFTTSGPVVTPPGTRRTVALSLSVGKLKIARILKQRGFFVRTSSDQAAVVALRATVLGPPKKVGKGRKHKKVRRAITIAKATVRFTTAGTRTVKLTLTGAGRKALRGKRRVQITITAIADSDKKSAKTLRVTATR